MVPVGQERHKGAGADAGGGSAWFVSAVPQPMRRLVTHISRRSRRGTGTRRSRFSSVAMVDESESMWPQASVPSSRPNRIAGSDQCRSTAFVSRAIESRMCPLRASTTGAESPVGSRDLEVPRTSRGS